MKGAMGMISHLQLCSSWLKFGAESVVRLGKARLIVLLLPVLVFSAATPAFAGSATWKTNPSSSDWNTARNWSPMTVPNGASDTATFDSSNTRTVSLSANTEVNGIIFNPGASSFAITTGPHFMLTISDVGILNNSGIAQNFVCAADIPFNREIVFVNSASAGDATFTIEGARADFLGNSTADNATFMVDSGTTKNANGGSLVFLQHSTAGNATLIAYGNKVGGSGAVIGFVQHSRGAKVRVKLLGDDQLSFREKAVLDISGSKALSLTIGSIEGNGRITLGTKTLMVGSNNLNTSFSGSISDGGVSGGGAPGSLTKIGSGKLVLSHANDYSGSTTIERGKLLINNFDGSGTGSGPVQVSGGSLGGKGVIAGAVTIGTGSGPGAVLSPGYVHGAGRTGAMTINSPLTFNSDGIYETQLNSSTSMADKVVALGVTIKAGAQFVFVPLGQSKLPAGTVFTIISNTAVTPISGTFANLSDGMTFTGNGNTYRANYESGDGNDLTLTVQ